MPASGKMAAQPNQDGIRQAILLKLVLFAILMAVVPIGSYFGSLHYFYPGNTTVSAIAAVISANIVLVGYVAVAFAEDAQEKKQTKENKSL